MENVERPSTKDTDEDVLKQQELFLKNKIQPSVTLVKNERKVSQNKTTLDSLQNKTINSEQDDELVIHKEDILFEVQERTFSNEPFVFKLPSVSPDEIFNLMDKKLKPSKFATKQKAKNIFTRLMENEKEVKISSNLPAASPSLLITGSGLEKGMEEVQNIHEENLAKISAMSMKEIQKYQKQFMDCLDPSIVQFIQNKRKIKKDNSKSNNQSTSSSSIIKAHKIRQNADQSLAEGQILRKEGKSDCDALLLQRSFEQEAEERISDLNNSSRPEVIEIPEETKKLLEGSYKSKWKNMDKVEKEKLEWLSELPKPNPINLKTGYSARFDFEGKPLAHDLDIPTHKGLHHHGQEPEVAGYSLEELFLLARSSLQSQRITALHTLAHILDNYWYGMMDSCFDSPLLPVLLEAGIVPLLRWSLDDTSVTSVAATVTAIHSLLICKPDEACLHKTFCWLNGHILPQVKPTDLEEQNIVTEELTDANLIKLDVIKGFLRIDILPRFLYILQVMQPPPLVCKLIIEICCHLSQHSMDLSCQVAKSPGLLNLIFEKFLPITWQYVDGSKLTDTVNYSCPSPSALKLMRIFASSNKELALFLVENFEFIKVITVYLTLRPIDEKLSLFDVQNLMVEALKTLNILLFYGFGIEVFLDLYPIFLKQIEFCISLSLKAEESKHCKDFEYATHFFKTLEALVIVSTEEKESSELKTLLSTIFKQSLLCLKKWLFELKQAKPSDSAMTLLAAALNFISTYYKISHKGLTCDDWEPCSIVKDLYSGYLIPSVKSAVFRSLLDNIQSYSILLNSDKSGNKRDGKTIVSLGSVLWEGDVVPTLKEGTPIPLLLAMSNFIFIHKTLFNSCDNQPINDLLTNSSILEYLRKISIQKLNAYSWFDRFEIHLIALLLKLSRFIVHDNSTEWLKIAVSILPILKISDECLVADLLENMIFNKEFLPSSNKKETQDVISLLPVISKCYTSYFLSSALNSRNIPFSCLELDSVSSLSNPEFMLSKDWCYTPIYDLYLNSSKRKTSESLAPEELLLVTSSLQWILFCRELRLPLLKKMLPSVEFCYLSMVFLLDWDSFRCPKVKSLLELNLLGLLRDKSMNFSKVISSNINSFDDLYLELLNQFEAVSYGDLLFGNFILVPLQQCHQNTWKKVLLTDHSDAICFLRVPLTKLFVPLQKYLEPHEKDITILKEYLILLKSGTLTQPRCPLLYLMAIHHIHQFIFLRSHEHLKFQKYLISNITVSMKEVWKRHLLFYSNVNVESECGFTLKEQLTASDKQHLADIVGHSVKL